MGNTSEINWPKTVRVLEMKIAIKRVTLSLIILGKVTICKNS